MRHSEILCFPPFFNQCPGISPFMPLVGDTSGIRRPIEQLNKTATCEAIRFQHMLHCLIVGTRVRPHVSIMLDTPIDAVLGRASNQSRRGDTVNCHIRIVIQPGTINMRICGVLSRAQCELRQYAFRAANGVGQQNRSLMFDISANHFLARKCMSPLRGITADGHKFTSMLINSQYGWQIIHGGSTEMASNRDFAQSHSPQSHLFAMRVKNTMPTAQFPSCHSVPIDIPRQKMANSSANVHFLLVLQMIQRSLYCVSRQRRGRCAK